MLGIGDSGGITVERKELFGFFLVFIYLSIYLSIYLLICCVCSCTSHTKHAGVRGQLRESALSLNCVGSCFVSVSLLNQNLPS